MDAQIETIGPCRKQVSITIPPDEVKAKIEESYVQLRTTVDTSIDKSPLVTGFRKGHIPRRLLEKRFGDQIMEDVREQLIRESYEKALEDKSLVPIGEPDFGELPKLVLDQPLSFKAIVEVKPEFDLDAYKGIEVQKPLTEVNDEEVAARLEHVREANATVEEVKDDGAGERDILTCSVTALADGKEVWSRPQAFAVAGGTGIAGMPVDGFADLMRGVKAGEQREAAATLPEDIEAEELRGKPVTLRIKVERVQRPIAPEVNEQWAKQIGFESLDALRDAIRRQVRREKEDAARHDMDSQIERRLLETVTFELPEGIVKSHSDALLRRGRLRLMQAGTPEDKLDEEMEKLRPSSAEEAGRELRLFFILDKIGQKEKIFATEDDVSRAVQAMAMQYRRKPLEIVEMLQQQGGMSELRVSLRERKIRDFLVDEAKQPEAQAGEPEAEKAE